MANVATTVLATSAVATFVGIIGDALLLFGVVLAIAATLPFYAEEEWSAAMQKWGLIFTCLGAACVLLGNANEVPSDESVLKWVTFAVMGLAASGIVLILAMSLSRRGLVLLPLCIRRIIRSRKKANTQEHQEKEADKPYRVKCFVLFQIVLVEQGRPYPREREEDDGRRQPNKS